MFKWDHHVPNFACVLYETDKFHVTLCLYSNKSQKTSKCSQKICDTVDYALYTSLLFLALCDLFCYLLQNRCQVTWCLSVKLISPGWALNCEFIPDFVSHNFVTFSGSRTGICSLRLHELLQMHYIFNLFQEALAMMSFQRCIFIPIQCFLSLLIIFTWLVSLELSQEEYLWVEKMAVFMK